MKLKETYTVVYSFSIWTLPNKYHLLMKNSHFSFFVIQVHPNYTLIQMEHFYLQIYRNGTTVYFQKIKEAICTCLECKTNLRPVNAFKIYVVYSKTSFIRKKNLRISIQSYITWDTWRTFMATCTILFSFCSKNL